MSTGGVLTLRCNRRTGKEGRLEGGLEGEELVFEVADTGSGIAPEVLPRIFEPFFTTKPLGVGTGIGLPTVRKIVEEHRGRIEVESPPGQGATFRIILPAAGDAMDEERWRGEGERDAVVSVLLMEDEITLRTILEQVLKDLGCAVAIAGDAAEGLAALQAPGVGFDLLVVDLRLRDMRGADLVGALDAAAPGLPIVGLSDVPQEELFRGNRALFERLQGFLLKPFTAQQLLGVVKPLMRKGVRRV